MKFIHTGNWHLGMPFTHVQDKADSLRQARVDAVKQVIALAEKERVDFVLAAGDLFDDNRISAATVEPLAAAVSRCNVPLYLLPGCRDPLTQDSPYVRCQNLFTGSAMVMRTSEPVTLPHGGTLFPCPARTRADSKDPTAWIPPRTSIDGIRIGLANGSLSSDVIKEFPIDPKSSTLRELDYLALGHSHGVRQLDDRSWYCGTPESTDFEQPDAGKVLLVEIAAPQENPKVREIPLYRYVWCEMDSEVNSDDDVNQLIDDIDEMSDPQMLLRVRVTGTLTQPLLERIERISGERFFHFKMELEVAVTDGTLEYRHPLLRQMADVLTAKTASGGEDAAIARRAMSKLSTFVKQAGFQQEEV